MPQSKTPGKTTLSYGSLVVLQCLLWGFGNPMAKIGFLYLSPLFGLVIRFVLSFCFFMLFWGRRIVKGIGKPQIFPCFLVSMFTALAFNCAILALYLTTATNAGFLMSLAVLCTPFLSRLFLKTKLSALRFLPVAVVLVGLYLLCSDGGRFSFGAGELLALASSVAGACMLTFSAKYLPQVDPFALSAMQCGVTAVLSALPAFLLEPLPNFAAMPLVEGWGILLYMVIPCTCVAYMLQNTALRHISATYAALLFSTEPIFTAIFSRIMLGERLTSLGVAGAALITVSIVAASLLPEPGKSPLPAPPQPFLSNLPAEPEWEPDTKMEAVPLPALDNPFDSF